MMNGLQQQKSSQPFHCKVPYEKKRAIGVLMDHSPPALILIISFCFLLQSYHAFAELSKSAI
jgi:hypothetical protein